VFLNDIIVFSKSADEHLRHVERAASATPTAAWSAGQCFCKIATSILCIVQGDSTHRLTV